MAWSTRELAELAGTTVNTIRHYHALGLLERPSALTWAPGARLQGTGYDDPRWTAFQQSIMQEEAALALAAHPALLAVMRTIYEGPPLPHRGSLCRLGTPQAPELTTPPHQDHHYVGGSLDIWTAWLPLTPCPLSLGPLVVCDGSHRGGYLPHSGEGAGRQQVNLRGAMDWRSQAVTPGDVVFFHCLTVHAALPNTSPNTLRLSMDVRFQPEDQPVTTRRVDGSEAGPQDPVASG